MKTLTAILTLALIGLALIGCQDHRTTSKAQVATYQVATYNDDAATHEAVKLAIEQCGFSYRNDPSDFSVWMGDDS